jgi:hypothetical protein
MPMMVGMVMRMGVMAFKAHGNFLTRLIRDYSLACQTAGRSIWKASQFEIWDSNCFWGGLLWLPA